jgi:alpha-D-ribose 1-methylphosphonate 5-triphosphate synthase subunit PhnG
VNTSDKGFEQSQSERQLLLGLLAKAPQSRVAQLLDAAFERPDFTWLRKPEIGSVMVRGRAGGTGVPFNLGEMTVTRCTLRLSSGEVGHAYVQGRRKDDAEASAIIDALMQTKFAASTRTHVLVPLQDEMSQRHEKRAAKAAATKVDFFTLVRGED